MFNRILTFLLVFIFSACIFAQQIENKSNEQIIDVNFCDLLKNTNNYKDKIVRISAIYTVGFEVSGLYCPDCEKNDAVWAECSKDAENCIPKKFKKKFREKNYGTGKTLKVTLIGKFNVGGRFGHMGAYSNQFLIQTIENAETVLDYGGIRYQALSEKDKTKVSCKTESKKS